MADLTLYIGYYGRNNIGDDLMLEVLYVGKKHFIFLQDLNTYHFIPKNKQILLSKSPFYRTLQKFYYLVKLKIKGVKNIVFGGGTQFSSNSSLYTQLDILFFVFLAWALGYKLNAESVGIGSFSSKNKILYIALKLFHNISVRDKTSSNKLKSRKLIHTLTSDLVYKLKFKIGKVKKPKLTLITATGPVLSRNVSYTKKYLDFLEFNLDNKNEKIVFVVFQKGEDEFIFDLLKKKFENIKMIIPESKDDIEKLYNNSKEVIGMRYHSLILADIFKISFKGFSYDDKVKDLCKKNKMLFTSAL